MRKNPVVALTSYEILQQKLFTTQQNKNLNDVTKTQKLFEQSAYINSKGT